MRDALVALSLKTNISIGGVDPASCGNRSQRVHGNYTPEMALRIMLGGGHCGIVRYNDTTFQLKPRAPAPPRPAPPPPKKPEPAGGDEATVVVIQRRPEALSSQPASVSIVGGGAMAHNDLDLSNLAARVPGLEVTNLGPGRDKILLRGISDSVLTGRTQSLVGLYLDDTPLTYNAPDPDLLLVDMARIEVLKGPQGALYGQGSLAGVVRLVANKPQAYGYESEISAGLGLTEHGHPSSRLTAMVNLPLIPDRLGLRAVLYNDEFGGFIHDEGPGPKASNSTSRAGGRFGVDWKINDDFDFTSQAVLQHLSSKNSQYVYSPQSQYHRTDAIAEPHDNDFEDYSAGLTGPVRWGTLKVSLNEIRHTIHTGYDAQPLGSVVSVPNSGVLFYDEDQNITMSTQEISLVSPSAGRLRWLAGWFSAEGVEHFTPHLVDLFTSRVVYNEDRLDKTLDYALFGQVSYDLSPKWTMTLGVREAIARHKTFSQINHVRLTNYQRMGDVVGNVRNDRLTHSLQLSYRPDANTLWYVQEADGFRTGGFNTTTLATTVVPSHYDGDHLDNFEAGLRWKTLNNKFRLNLAVFTIDWKDIQSDQLRSTGLPITLNIGDGTNTGLEAEGDWRVTPEASLHFAAQFNNPRLDRPGPLYPNDQGSGMPYIAKTSIGISADWDKPVGGLVFSNSATFSYRSRSPLNYGLLRNVRMGGIANLDLSSSVAVGQLRYAVRLDNAAAANGNSFAYGNPFSLNGSNQITPVRPRTLWLEVSRSY